MKKIFLRMIILIMIITMLCATIIYSDAEEANQDVLLGDSNSDTVVNVLDATIIQKYKAKLTDISKICINAADVDFDKEITIMDATMIQKYLAKMINSFSLNEYLDETEETTVPTETIQEQFYEENGNKYKVEYNKNGSYTKYIWIVDKEASTVNEVIYDTTAYAICNKCGKDISGNSEGKVGDLDPNYADMYMPQYHWHVEHCSSAWHVEYKNEFVGFNIVEVPEIGHWQQI